MYFLLTAFENPFADPDLVKIGRIDANNQYTKVAEQQLDFKNKRAHTLAFMGP